MTPVEHRGDFTFDTNGLLISSEALTRPLRGPRVLLADCLVSPLLLYHNASVYRTDLHGTIVVEANRSGHYTVRTGQGEAPRPPPIVPVTQTPSVESNPVSSCIDLNTASAGALRAIVHIGEVRAQEIIELRRIQPFRSVQDLVRVSGIGSARLRDIVAEGKACVRLASSP